VLEQDLTRLGRSDPLAPPPLDQLGADEALERGHLLRDRRLRVPEQPSGPLERPFLGDRRERRQLAQLHPQPGSRKTGCPGGDRCFAELIDDSIR
jgi:hypothetical protein